jgi:hypothetical protein
LELLDGGVFFQEKYSPKNSYTTAQSIDYSCLLLFVNNRKIIASYLEVPI